MTKSDMTQARVLKIEKGNTITLPGEFVDGISESFGLAIMIVKDKNVYLRGFGSFIVKKRAKKTARNISKNTTIIIPEHYIPSFKPAKSFVNKVKNNVKR